MSGVMEQYLEDPFLRRMYEEIRTAGALRSTQIDITHACNIRCTGCYFFAEELDRFKSPKNETDFDEFVEREKELIASGVGMIFPLPTIEIVRKGDAR